MDKNNIYAALAICTAVSVLIIGISIPLALGKVKRNAFYGFRTTKTLSSDEIWFPANRESGFNFIYAGIFILMTAAILFFIKDLLSSSTLVTLLVVVTIGSLFAAVIKSFIFLGRLPEKN